MRELMRQLDEIPNSTWPWKQTFLYAPAGWPNRGLSTCATVFTPPTIRPMRLPPARISLSQRRFGKGACLLIRVLNLGKGKWPANPDHCGSDCVGFGSLFVVSGPSNGSGFRRSPSIRLLLRSLWHFIAHSEQPSPKILTLGYGTKSATELRKQELEKRGTSANKGIAALGARFAPDEWRRICGISSAQVLERIGDRLVPGYGALWLPASELIRLPRQQWVPWTARLSDLH